jgi:hydroxymethylbilane synthase
MNTLRIATRESPLALWQAHHVQAQLQQHHPNLSIELIPRTTPGDQKTDCALGDVGGKTLFVKNIQRTVLEGHADIAVHALKDMAVDPHPDLTVVAFLKRGDARDAWVSPKHASLAELPQGACIGTGSPRRQCQIHACRPDLRCMLLRGNVQSRLQKIEDPDTPMAGSILAAAGLQRLGLEDHIRSYLPIETHIPAIGQGIIAVECLRENIELHALLQCLNHAPTALCATAERAMNQALQGSCFTPLAAHATLHGERIHLHAMLGHSDGHAWYARTESSVATPEVCGFEAADALLKQGGDAARALLDPDAGDTT